VLHACLFVSDCFFFMLCYSGDPLYGENLYWGWSSDPNFCLKVRQYYKLVRILVMQRRHLYSSVQGWEAVDSWYEESLAAYNYDKEPPDSSSGMFLNFYFPVFISPLYLVNVSKHCFTVDFYCYRGF
jgi:hypothetical protein